MTSRRIATFRLAWRLVRKSRARSVLIALLVAIPVMAGAFAAVTIRTAHLSPAEAADRELGRADAIAIVRNKPITSGAEFGRVGDETAFINVEGAVPTDASWARLLPAGSRVTPDGWTRAARIDLDNRSIDVQGVVLDLSDPVTQGIYRLLDGTVPRGADQVALTQKLARHLSVGVGAHVAVQSRQVRVSAIIEAPDSLDTEEVVSSAATYGGLAATPKRDWYSNVGTWLIDTPSSAPDIHDRMLRAGVIYETRHQWEYPGPRLRSSSQVDGQVLVVLGTVAGFGLLEVLLLAGAAFAVGTRRQTRELGLLAANGGDDLDIRRSVLAQGALLGVGGAIIGTTAGVAAVVLLRGVLEQAADKRFGTLDVGAFDLVAVAALGIVSGLLAAIVPARAAAARSVLHMLRERYDADGQQARAPRWSIVALLLGSGLIIASAVGWHTRSGSLHSEFVETGSPSAVVHGLATLLRHNAWPAALWFGAALTLSGLVRACPAIVSRLGTIRRPLPLSPRLALRDAGRHRHRTAPAVAAVMTVVAGAVLVLFVVSSSDLQEKQQFRPVIPLGLINVGTSDTKDSPRLADAAARTASLVGGGRHVVIDQVTTHQGELATVQAPVCLAAAGADDDLANCQFHRVGVATTEAIDLITGRSIPAVDRALDNGAAVVLDPRLAVGGRVEVRIGVGTKHAHTTRLPAVPVPGLPAYGGLSQIFVSPATASAQGWQTDEDIALVKPTTTPSTEVMDRALQALGSNVYIYLERGYHSRYSTVLLAMLGAAAIATLAGTSIAVALAMAESRADMATMAAVGASPTRRRVHAMGQAAIVAGLGTGLGVALGALVALATLGGSERYPTSTPFRWLAAVLIVAPALAILVAGAVTRNRVTLTRRIA